MLQNYSFPGSASVMSYRLCTELLPDAAAVLRTHLQQMMRRTSFGKNITSCVDLTYDRYKM